MIKNNKTRFLGIILIIFGLLSCEQYKASLEDFLRYWSSEARIIREVKNGTIIDKDGCICFFKGGNNTVVLELHNPVGYSMKTPKEGSSSKEIINFGNIKGSAGADPIAGTDYKFTQSDSTHLKLEFTDAFINCLGEWGDKDIGPVITLYDANSERVFSKSFTPKIRVNTPPPKAKDIVIAKNKDATPKYVLCIPFEKTKIEALNGTEKIHKDIAKIAIGSKTITITLDGLKRSTTSPAQNCLVVGSVAKFDADLPTDEYTLFYNTGIEFAEILPKYIVQLIDAKGLKGEVTQSPVMFGEFYIASTGDDTNGDGSQSKPFASLQKAVDSCARPDLTYTIYVMDTVTGDNAKATINGSKKINIQSATGATGVLDANKTGRILEIKGSATVRLENITLTNGNTESETNKDGAGILVTDGNLTINNSKIANCWAGYYDTTHSTIDPGNGGGIYITSGTVDIVNSTITECNSYGNGGGVYIQSGTVTFTDTNIITCEAAISSAGDGGGVFISSGEVTMNGSTTINDCKANGQGKAIALMSGNLILKDAVEINENNDVYLANGKTITVDGNLTGAATVVTITPETYPTTGSDVTVLIGSAIATNKNKFKVTPQDLAGTTQEWAIDNSGKLVKPPVVIDGSAPDAWTTLKAEVENPSGASLIKIKGTITAPSSDAAIEVNRTVSIKKGGSSSNNAAIDANTQCQIFKVTNSANFSIERVDLLNGKTNSDGGGAIYFEGTYLTLNALQIAGCEAVNGGAIYVAGGDSIKLTDVIVQNCTATQSGGAIYVKNGDVTIGGSTIGGTGSNGSNTASSTGGGLYIAGGSVTMETDTNIVPSKIIGNKSNGNGAGVYIEKGTLTMVNGEISGNTATSGNGAGVYISNNSEAVFDMQGGDIGDNRSSASQPKGKGVYVHGLGVFKMSGDATVDYSSGDNDVYLAKNGTNTPAITITGNLSASSVATIGVVNNDYVNFKQVLTADTGVTLANEVSKFKVKKQTNPVEQEWGIDLKGRLEIKLDTSDAILKYANLMRADLSFDPGNFDSFKNKWIVYKTNKNAFGKLMFLQKGASNNGVYIRFKYKTFTNSSNIISAESAMINPTDPFTNCFNLDKELGNNPVSTTDANADFENELSPNDKIKPKNGCIWYMLP